MAKSFAEALKDFEDVQSKYARFGAADTESRSELWTRIDEMYHNGRRVAAPSSVRGWQLFTDMKGVGKAAEELYSAAEKAITAAKRDPQGVNVYLGI